MGLDGEVIADGNLRGNHAEFASDPLANALEAFEEVSAAIGVGQSNQAVSDGEFHGVHSQPFGHGRFSGRGFHDGGLGIGWSSGGWFRPGFGRCRRGGRGAGPAGWEGEGGGG